MRRVVVYGILIFTFIFASDGYTKEYQVKGVTHYSQDFNFSCGHTVAQMWIKKLTGKKIPQATLVWLVGTSMSSYDLERVLECYTGRSFDVNGHGDKFSCKKKIYKEIREQKRPLAIAGTVVRKDWSKVPGRHWLLIWAADINKKEYYLNYVKIHDPLYRSRYAGNYQVIRINQKIHYNELFDTFWRSWENGQRHSVDD